MFLRHSLRFSVTRRLGRISGDRLGTRAASFHVYYGTRTSAASEHISSNSLHHRGHYLGVVHFSTATSDDDLAANEASVRTRMEGSIDDELEQHEEEVLEIQTLDEIPGRIEEEAEDQDEHDQVAFRAEDDETDALEAKTERLISVLETYGDDGKEGTNVNLAEIGEAIDAWAARAAKRDGDIYFADKAAELLEALEQNISRIASCNNLITWDIAWYNNVMHAYAVCHGGRKAAEKAEAILLRMIQACQDYKPSDATLAPPEPTTPSFNIPINAWAKSGEADSGTHAEGIVTRMEQWSIECNELPGYHGAVANARTMSGVMDAWAQSGSEGAEERVLSILMYAIQRQQDSVQAQRHGEPPLEGTVVKPNVFMFNAAIHAWVNSERGLEGAEQAEAILRMMEKLAERDELGEVDENDSDDLGLKPTNRTLSLVIDAWAQCENIDKTGKAAQRAQDILDMMERLYREGQDVKPSYVSFTSCIAAWSRSERHKYAAVRAEALLDRLLKLYEETDDKDFKPTVSTGNAVISAFAKSERFDSIKRAKAVFERLKDFCEPDAYSYNSVMNAYAKKGEGLMAKNLLQEMEDACDSGNAAACPDGTTYHTTIYALSKSSRQGSAEEAEQLLNKMNDLYNQGRTDLIPTTAAYTSVIAAWGRARQAENANRVLRSVVDAYKAGDESLKPDVKMFTAAINACARSILSFTEQKRNVLRIAIQTFEEMKNTPEFDNPNAVTFRSLMKSCNQLSTDPAERSRLLKAIFQQACQDGMVSKLVLATLKEGVSRKEFAEITIFDGRYPHDWSRNVPRRNRP